LKLFGRRVEPINLGYLLSGIHLRSEFGSIVSRYIPKVFAIQATNPYRIFVIGVFRLTDKLKMFSSNATAYDGLPISMGDPVGVEVEVASLVATVPAWLLVCWIVCSSG